MDADQPTERELRGVVREEIRRAARSLLSTIVWTVLAILGVLVGLQAVQLAFFSVGLAATLAFAAGGAVVTACSVYLLYVLHFRH